MGYLSREATMKISISTLVDLEEQGLMKTRLSPCGNLRVACYSQKAQFEKAWDYYTTTCRGIVIEETTGEVKGMCLPKFFNLNEVEETKLANLPWNEDYEIFDKVDGSLLTVFEYNDVPWMTTKCSFTTIYSDFAYKQLDELHLGLPKNITLAGEVRLPDELETMRRVTDKEPGIYFFAAFDRDTGEELPFSYLEELKLLEPKLILVDKYDWDLKELSETFYSHKETEGYVIKFANGLRVKFKTAWYLYLNRLLAELGDGEKSRKFVKGMIKMYEDDSEWIANMPDELYVELTELADKVREDYRLAITQVETEVLAGRALYGDSIKDFALSIQNHPYRSQCFCCWKGQEYKEKLLEVI